MDAFDAVAIVGFGAIIVLSSAADVEPVLLGAVMGGFVLSLSLWQLFDGHVWEALGWLAWVGAAVFVVLGPGGNPLLLVVFIGLLFLGIGLQFGGRFDLLPDVWTVQDRG